jgi:hypothetical protein
MSSSIKPSWLCQLNLDDMVKWIEDERCCCCWLIDWRWMMRMTLDSWFYYSWSDRRARCCFFKAQLNHVLEVQTTNDIEVSQKTPPRFKIIFSHHQERHPKKLKWTESPQDIEIAQTTSPRHDKIRKDIPNMWQRSKRHPQDTVPIQKLALLESERESSRVSHNQ